MPSIKYALPMLAAAGYASAACSASATKTIENSGDATAIASCSTYSGSIAVATGMADDISFGQLKEIDGDLTIETNNNVKRIDGNGLEKISGELSIKDTTQLAALSFPKLDEVKKLTFIGLASLRSLAFDKGITTVEDLWIQNTELQNLAGINLKKAKSVVITANKAITNITMGLTNLTGPVDISNNNAKVEVSFPNLESATNMSFRAVGNLSLPALKTVTPGSFGIFNSDLKSFYALNFTETKDAFTIFNNTQLEDMSLGSLEKVGSSFRVESNTKLGEIKMPELESVGAALDISGKNLTKVEMPKLDYVKGVFNLQSEGDLGNTCDAYKKLNDQNKVGPKNKFKCEGKLQKAGNAGTSSGSQSSSSPSDSAATPVQVQTYLGLAGLFAAMFM